MWKTRISRTPTSSRPPTGLRRALAIALLAVPLLAGCGTINSYASSCPGSYSGVKTDAAYVASYDSFHDGFDWLTVVGDLPLSLVADTLVLPLSLALEPVDDPPSTGCSWVARGPGESRWP